MLRSFYSLAALALLFLGLVSANDKTLTDKLVKTYKTNTLKRLPTTGTCTAKNIVVRKEWGNLTSAARLDYIKAVKCLKTLPSKIDPAKAPGARTRYDDFQAAHIIQTTVVHGTGSFFAWHRHLIWLYETALRDECGYKGYQPYWDWSKYANKPLSQNPLIDGSATSMSGNGKYIAGRNGTLQPFPIPVENPPALYCPPGTGGGFVYNGPLVDWQLNLGPVVNNVVTNGLHVNPNPRADGLGYNPRRLIRDFNNTLLQDNTYAIVNKMLVNMTSIHEFHPYFFQVPHTAGHLFISGYDNDLFTSPGDPLFYFHHAQVDRMWALWQGMDFATREFALDGTLTMLDLPPTRNATLDDVMKFEFSPDISINERMSPTAHGLCYIYE
ncbi:hypothetical protein V500_02113 [Pseudogymnoascus sp. VKM F-4518 (FW-2643)]|nr:hypothetical protein V500_02113 [Pseudogymnoascus sp. VKM F-4518 (FW-2643)]KFZ08797.1 hypothetical protein V502_09111 [Pseudogymnoascus sp. VKM F-4520 (FW-2644)]